MKNNKYDKKYDVICNYFNANTKGIYIIEKDNLYGIMNEKERYILEPIYNHIRDFVEGFARVQKYENDKYKYNLVNQEGQFISADWFDDTGEFSCGLCEICLDGEIKYIRKDGTDLKNFIFYATSEFCDNVAKVKFNYNDDWCFIDTNGEILKHETYPKIKNGYEPTYVICSKQGNILQIRSSKVCVRSIEKFEEEIIKERLCKTDEKSFLKLARKIKKDFEK